MTVTSEEPFTAPTIIDALKQTARIFGRKPAVSRGTECITYSDLLDHVNAMADRFRAVDINGPTLVVPRNSPASLALVYGAIAAGSVPLLTDPVWTSSELASVVKRCGCRLAAWEGECSSVQGLVQPGRTAQLDGITLAPIASATSEMSFNRLVGDARFGRFTSGTTGYARCLQFTERAALNAAASWRASTKIGPGDRVLCLASINNGLAFNTSLLPVLLSGGEVVFFNGRLLPNAVIQSIDAVRPTIFVAFPFIYELLSARADAIPRYPELRLCVSSAAPLSQEIGARWREATGLDICDYYGVAEVGPCTFNDGTQPGTLGRPLGGVEFLITDASGRSLEPGEVGQIRIKTASMAAGYLDDMKPSFSDHLDPAGFFVTKDKGYVAEGRLTLQGRLDTRINIAGRKIDPTEVENVIRLLPGVDSVTVHGESAKSRTFLVAYVESRSVDKDAVLAHCLRHLASYKIPQLVKVVRKLARSSSGKVSVYGEPC